MSLFLQPSAQPSTHFLIPFAAPFDDFTHQNLPNLTLPHLTAFLQKASCTQTWAGANDDLLWPHEQVLGLQAAITVTPCHWQVGIDRIYMHHPEDLQITEEESRTLWAAIAPYFQQEQLILSYHSPLNWQAIPTHPEIAGQEALASLDRVIGQSIDVWQQRQPNTLHLRRLQNEMQMLLYQHPINTQRQAKHLPEINSLWLGPSIQSPPDHLTMLDQLRPPFLRSDGRAWMEAWPVIDPFLANAQSITLCGKNHAKKYTLNHSLNHAITHNTTSSHWMARLSQLKHRLFDKPPSFSAVLSSL